MKTKQKSQVEYGPKVPNYAVLNSQLQHQTTVSAEAVSKQRVRKSNVKPNASKPT
jgi:hypothetical protein